MIFREYLVMRKAVLWFVGIALAGALFAFGLSAAQSHTSTNGSLTELMGPIGYTTALFAAIFGVALGNASREPARVLWTLPEGRLRSALGVIGVDLVGIVVAFIGLWAAFLAVVLFYGLVGLADVRIKWSLDGVTLLRMIGFMFAVYGWSALFGMLIRRVAYGGIIALPALLLFQILAQSKTAFGELMRWLSVVDPWIVVSAFHRGSADDVLSMWYSWLTEPLAATILFAIAVLTSACAVVLWQRAQLLNV